MSSYREQYEAILAGRQDGYVQSACLQCVGNCGISVYVNSGRAVSIEGNLKDPNNQGRLCAKGQAGLAQLYDRDRNRHPMERDGERGSGKWRRISWDEALNKIAGRLARLRAEGKPERLVFYSGRNMMAGYSTRFAHAFGTPNHFNHDSICANARTVACAATMGEDWPLPDYRYARYILLLGTNRFETNLPYLGGAWRLAEAMERGAKLVVVDPRFNMTAAKAHRWIPVRPGTDAALVMGMIHTIVQEGLYDRAFMEEWTEGFAEFTEQVLPAYAPEVVAAICGVSADTIREVAREFATTRPAVADWLRGVCSHQNGAVASRAVLTLNALVGNLDQRGGLCFTRAASLSAVEPVPPVPTQPKLDLSDTQAYPLAHNLQHLVLPTIARGDLYPVDTVICYHASPAYSTPQPNLQVEVLRDTNKVPFLVSIDPFYGETSHYADIILPEVTYLERWDLVSWPFSFEFRPYIFLRKPVVQPLYEARQGHDILRDLALQVGGGMETYFADDIVTYLKKEVAGLGVDWEQLLEEGVWQDPQPRAVGRYRAGGFHTPSGKFEIKSRILEEKGFNPFPAYEPIPQHTAQRKQEYPFHLITFKLNVHNQSRTANVAYLLEAVGENSVEIHPEDAARLGIADGELVEVRSESGAIRIKAKVTAGIAPGVVGISHHFGHTQYGTTARGRGANPNWVITCFEDRLGGMVAYNDTLVAVEKVGPAAGQNKKVLDTRAVRVYLVT